MTRRANPTRPQTRQTQHVIIPEPDLALLFQYKWKDPEDTKKAALEHWQKGEIFSLMCKLSQQDYIPFVIANRVQLKAVGMYEQALYNSFVADGHAGMEQWIANALLAAADHDKLRAAGKPYDATKPITLYRGTHKRSVTLAKRNSWTSDIKIAKWFAARFIPKGKNQPTVYELLVPPEHILFFSNDREESEYFIEMWPGAKPNAIMTVAYEPPPERNPKDSENGYDVLQLLLSGKLDAPQPDEAVGSHASTA